MLSSALGLYQRSARRMEGSAACLSDARRYDRSGGHGSIWHGMVRQRYRYDASNQRLVKQTLDASPGLGEPSERVHLYVYPGRFERSGVITDGEGTGLTGFVGSAILGSETHYTVGGARAVRKSSDSLGPLFAPERRLTYAVKDVIQSTSAVVDLISGELLELTTFYPNGARETHRTQGDASVQLELNGFTGKEADEEVGVVYFGERYLIPRIGRWASPDPLAIHAAGGGEALNAYHYVSGNLLQARDPVGLDPSKGGETVGWVDQETIDHAKLAAAVYEPGSALPDGWARVSNAQLEALGLDPSRFEDNSRYSGFRSALYTHEESGRYVLAFAGTDLPDHDDHINNIHQALSLPALQYTQAVSLAVDVKESLHDFTGTKLTLVGHSLGGGLASAVAIASASRAVTFNAAGLSGRQLTLGRYRGTVSWLEVSPGSSYVSAYYTSDDWLSDWQDALSFLPSAIGRRLRIASEFLATESGHGIAGTVEALEIIYSLDQESICVPRSSPGSTE